MIRRSVLFFTLIIVLSATGCIKDTYDMNKLSNKVQLSPSLVISAVNGNITFSELNFNFIGRATFLVIDTVDNFMKVDGSDKDNPVKPENFEKLQVVITANNGYPLKVSLKMDLYSSNTHTITSKIPVEAKPSLEPAPTDSNGKITGTGLTKTTTRIDFTREFLSSVPRSDKVIFRFTFSTPDNGTHDVQIIPNYKIYFDVALIVKPVINLN